VVAPAAQGDGPVAPDNPVLRSQQGPTGTPKIARATAQPPNRPRHGLQQVFGDTGISQHHAIKRRNSGYASSVALFMVPKQAAGQRAKKARVEYTEQHPGAGNRANSPPRVNG